MTPLKDSKTDKRPSFEATNNSKNKGCMGLLTIIMLPSFLY